MPDTSSIQSFGNIDQAKWDRIKAAVKDKAGIDISANTGQATAKGITLSWAYDQSTSNLTVNLVKRSWFDPSSDVIESDLADMVKSA
jgi:hypothetical protein